MAIALENSIIEESQDCHVIVDTRDGITRGQTIVDYFDVEGKNQNVRVVTKSSNKKFMSLLLDLLR
jgi:inosine-uridine nucleoside N-ribohydrolase